MFPNFNCAKFTSKLEINFSIVISRILEKAIDEVAFLHAKEGLAKYKNI